MALGDLVARLAWDGSAFEAGTARVNKQVNTLEGAFTRVGSKWGVGGFLGRFLGPVAIIGAVTSFSKSLAEDANEIQKLADKFGLSTDAVQLLQAEAERTNVEFSKLVESSEAINKALASASEHGLAATFTREQLGALTDTGGMFSGLGKAIKQAGAETLRQAHYILTGGIGHDLAFMLGITDQPFSQARPKSAAQREAEENRAEAIDQARLDASSKWAAGMFEEYEKREKALEQVRQRAGGYNLQSDALLSVGNFLGSRPTSQITFEQMNQKVDRIIQIMERETGLKLNRVPL